MGRMIAPILQFVRQFDRNLWILSVGWFVSALGFAASLPFIAIYFHSHFGMSMTEIGLFFGAMAIVRSVFQGIGGEIADRVPRSWLLVHSQNLRALFFAMEALAIYYDWGFWWVAIFLFMMSIFGAIFQPTANALVSDIVPREKRLEGYAVTRSAGNLGWAAGPALGGFLATVGDSYAYLFFLSAGITFASGLVFWTMLKVPEAAKPIDRFRMKDLISIKDDPLLAKHSILIFLLYLVVAQLMVPFSVYSVEMVGITEEQLGYLYTLNGLLVVAAQIPITRLFSKVPLATQLALGSFIYAIGYGMVGTLVGYGFFAFAIVVVTTGEMLMSPPSLTVTSRLAPEGRMGRYMGIFGFFVASGWSFGPLFGGWVLDHFGNDPALAWMIISSLGIVSGAGYLLLGKSFTARVEEGPKRSGDGPAT